MKKLHTGSMLLILALSILSIMSFSQEKNAPLMSVGAASLPTVAIKPKELSIHGDTRTDNYYWLNERENPEVIKYLNDENAYLNAVMQPIKPFQEKLFEEMKARIKEKDESVPYKADGYYYYTRYETGKQYPIYCRKKEKLTAPEEIMLEGNLMAKNKKYFAIGRTTVSTNNSLLAYSVDTISRRIYTIYFKNLLTGKLLKDKIPNTTGSVVWANDNKTVFYTKQDLNTLLPYQLYKHVIGTDVKTDKLIYEEKDNTFYLGVSKSKSKKYIFAVSGSTVSTEYRFLDADNPDSEWKLFLPRERDHLYSVEHFGDKFYVLSNWKAKNFRLMETQISDSNDRLKWKDVIAHRDNVLLEDIDIFKDYLVVSERKEGLMDLRIIKWKDKSEHYVNFGEPAYYAFTSANPEFNTSILRFGYTSMTTPSSTFDYNMASKSKKLMKQQDVLGGFKKEDYVTERVYATSKDGIKIPISIVYKKGTLLNGTAPMLQYAYGSYGSSTNATFSSARLSLLNRGFVYALCHIRGGQEMGRWWYDDGKMFKKKNTFDDFITCTEFLVNQKYTDAKKVFAMGGSAGGLLMGAISNMRPDLYKGIVAAVPFVDVVTTMLDETIPLTTGEFDEWGNPKNKDSYEYMLSYSPYDQVHKTAYPNMLVTTGLHDSQVQYWEPAKWVAKLRTMKTDNNILMLHTNMDAGHGGASGRFDALKEVALEYVFILDMAGIKN